MQLKLADLPKCIRLYMEVQINFFAVNPKNLENFLPRLYSTSLIIPPHYSDHVPNIAKVYFIASYN